MPFALRRMADLGGPALREVVTATFRPKGARYHASRLKRFPIRALRGGPDGLGVAYALRPEGITVTILARGACTEDDTEWALAAARGIAALDDDPTEFFDLARQHPRIERLARRFDCRIPRTVTVFETFARVVIEQLVTTWEARNSTRKLFGHAGLLIEGTRLRAAPTPEAVLGVAPWKLRAFGIGVRRVRTLREGARRGAALERLRDVDPAIAIEKIQSLPGVGPWTANNVARDALAYADAVPVGDFHAHDLVSLALTGEPGDDARMLELLEPFRPHRSRAAHLLMLGQMAEALPGVAPRPLPRIDPHRREPWKY
ncbi:MAG: DNA-3-methyladenine glycosylase 2 family protein [Deltaproteobacteria bacterium]|nr:DNA-3-methyladenine glycosylase 2 family protein [Deltaproteobacteria bacterium]